MGKSESVSKIFSLSPNFFLNLIMKIAYVAYAAVSFVILTFFFNPGTDGQTSFCLPLGADYGGAASAAHLGYTDGLSGLFMMKAGKWAYVFVIVPFVLVVVAAILDFMGTESKIAGFLIADLCALVGTF